MGDFPAGMFHVLHSLKTGPLCSESKTGINFCAIFCHLRSTVTEGRLFAMTLDPRCCPCGNPLRPLQRNCLSCHALSMRKSRASNPLSDVQRAKDNCRSYAHVYLRRGKLTREPCSVCSTPVAQMHHADYAKPLQITWLCRPCHLALHRAEAVLPKRRPDVAQRDPFAALETPV